jgi:kinesin family protein 3/17
VVNEDLDQRTLLRKYERELKRLRAELQQRNRELVDKRALLEVGVCACVRVSVPVTVCL